MSLKYIVIKNTFPAFLSNAVSSVFIFAYFSSFYIFSVEQKGNFFVLKHIMEATKLQLDWQMQVMAGSCSGAVVHLSNADDSIWHQSIQCWQVLMQPPDFLWMDLPGDTYRDSTKMSSADDNTRVFPNPVLGKDTERSASWEILIHLRRYAHVTCLTSIENVDTMEGRKVQTGLAYACYCQGTVNHAHCIVYFYIVFFFFFMISTCITFHTSCRLCVSATNFSSP